MPGVLEDAERAWLDWMHSIAEPYFRVRSRQREAISDPQAWKREKNRLRACMIDALGGMFARSPLNPRIVGEEDFGDFRLQRLIFESVPGLWVTANVYLPARIAGRAPAILVPCGHAQDGKAAEKYRRLCINLALKGYMVLIYDPIGQGERHMYLAEDGSWLMRSCTVEHTHLAVQLATVGLSLAKFMVWESMRAVDYLLSRPDVDPRRIGCTGCSGGGTNTAYVAALDERIKVAAPVCYITSLWERQRSELIADYEQNLRAQIVRGPDHHDMLSMVAPRPLRILAAAKDFFPLPGAEESYEAAKRIYRLYGVEDRIDLFVADVDHGYHEPLRRAAYEWFNRWLEVDADDEEAEFDLPDAQTTLCLPDGQVPQENTFRAVLHQAREYAAALAPTRLAIDEIAEEIAARVGLVRVSAELVERSSPAEGWQVAELSGPGLAPLALAWRAEQPSNSCVALLPGPEALAGWDGAGAVILTLNPHSDLRSRAGESKRPWIHGRESFCAFYAHLLDRDLLYLRVRTCAAALAAVCRKARLDAVELHAAGTCALVAAHLALIEPEKIAALHLQDCLWSWQDLLECDIHVLGPAEVPWMCLGHYDLPDLLAALAPRPVSISRPLGPAGQPLSKDRLRDLEKIQRAYAAAGVPGAFRVDAGE